jgi:hypothetical protein
MTEAARIILEVQAGLIAERPEDEFTRRWVVPASKWDVADPKEQAELLADANGRMMGWQSLLMLQPERVNWVRANWIYL